MVNARGPDHGVEGQRGLAGAVDTPSLGEREGGCDEDCDDVTRGAGRRRRVGRSTVS